MKKFGRRIMAMTLAGAMMCAPMTAFAATGTTEVSTESSGEMNGSGNLEGFVDEDDQVFSVTLPTDDASSPTFDFVMDPQNLLKQTDSTNYSTPDTVLFSTKTGTSNELSITNNSQFDVDVTFSASVTGLTGEGYAINMASDDTFKDSENNNLTDTSLYLGLVYETATANSVAAIASTTKAVTSTGLSETVTLGGMPDNYKITKDTDGTYKYAQVSSPDASTGIAKFKMTGACNPNADWSAIADLGTAVAPSVKVVWDVEKHKENVDCTFTASSEVGVINYTKGSGTGELDEILSIEMVNYGTAYDGFAADAQLGWNDAVVGDSTITLDSTYIGYYAADTDATITYTTKGDSTPKTATVTVKVK